MQRVLPTLTATVTAVLLQQCSLRTAVGAISHAKHRISMYRSPRVLVPSVRLSLKTLNRLYLHRRSPPTHTHTVPSAARVGEKEVGIRAKATPGRRA